MSQMTPSQGSATAEAGRAVAAGQGWAWITGGFELFKKQPGMWIALVVVLFVILIVLSFLNILFFLGSIAMMLLTPVFVAGLMIACQAQQRGSPLEIGHLRCLQLLDLSSNQLRRLPPEIGQLTNLQSLYLSTNRLSELPPEIGQWIYLQTLDQSDNRLTELPADIGQLSHLQTLILSDNQLRALPPEIGQWSGLQTFWDKVFDWLGPPPQPIPAHETRVSFSGSQPLLDFYVYDERSANSEFRFSVESKTGRTEGAFKKLAPGHYQTTLPNRGPGDYRVHLIEEGAGHRGTYPSIGYTVPYHGTTEHPRLEFNHRLLDQVSHVTGGAINPRLSESTPEEHVSQSYQPLRNALIALVFALFLLEVTIRRLVFSETA